jgi:uncharacterized membrane protein YgdD (TMEM256/DUF423 family)
MNKRILITGSILGLTSIILGAFASHGLKNSLSPENIRSFEIGVKYQMYHAFFLLFIGSYKVLTKKQKHYIYSFTVIGVFLFSFSIYALSTKAVTNINFKPIGFLTPIGGLCLIVAWSLLLYALIKNKRI